jgi:hypothetical protein
MRWLDAVDSKYAIAAGGLLLHCYLLLPRTRWRSAARNDMRAAAFSRGVRAL